MPSLSIGKALRNQSSRDVLTFTNTRQTVGEITNQYTHSFDRDKYRFVFVLKQSDKETLETFIIDNAGQEVTFEIESENVTGVITSSQILFQQLNWESCPLWRIEFDFEISV